MNKQYAHIIYLNDYELPDDFFTWSAENQLDYLKKWDYGEYHEFSDVIHTCKATDDVFLFGDYIMLINSPLGSADLSIELKKDKN